MYTKLSKKTSATATHSWANLYEVLMYYELEMADHNFPTICPHCIPVGAGVGAVLLPGSQGWGSYF